jgi:hypothetical protein
LVEKGELRPRDISTFWVLAKLLSRECSFRFEAPGSRQALQKIEQSQAAAALALLIDARRNSDV